jgi:methylated-DNA-[protein]-cysteine S-methyltransferase
MKTKLPALSSVTIPTRVGAFTAQFTPRGLARLQFPSAKKTGARATAQPLPLARELTTQLNDYFDGKNSRFTVPLDLRDGTEFQRSVWRQMAKIPAGKTRSYKDLAARIGKPAAVRAVGGACGANPIPILIPCHRVVTSDGKLGGFSGGLHWKKKLLSLEKR